VDTLNTTTVMPNIDVPEDFACFMRLYIVTLQRPSEIARMEACQLDLEEGRWDAPRRIRAPGYRIPLSPFAVPTIQRAIAIRKGGESDAIFPACRNANGEASVDVLARCFRRLATALSWTDFSLRDIRRSGWGLLISPLRKSRGMSSTWSSAADSGCLPCGSVG